MNPEALRIALRGVGSNKLRSALTVLGILIGVGAVIVLVAVGTGSSAAVQSRIQALGTNTLTVFNRGGGARGQVGPQTQRICPSTRSSRSRTRYSCGPIRLLRRRNDVRLEGQTLRV